MYTAYKKIISTLHTLGVILSHAAAIFNSMYLTLLGRYSSLAD
jgi:hypothetical protein